MSNLGLDIKKSPKRIPEAYISVPIMEGQESSYLKINVLVKPKADPVAGHLVVVRETLDTKVVLGCLIDIEERVHQWLEIWYQNTSGNSIASSHDKVFNANRDDRWHALESSMNSIEDNWIIKTGWETQFPLPTFIDLDTKTTFHPVDKETGALWILCRDDSLLNSVNLPSYNCSQYRYLYLNDLGKKSPFVSLSSDAPQAKKSLKLNKIMEGHKHIVPLNPGGGRFLVMAFHPLGLNEYIDVLNGESWNGVWHGGSSLDPGDSTSQLQSNENTMSENGRLFLERRGHYGKVIEIFHLKLRLFADAVKAVYAQVNRSQCPFLDLSGDSFRVRMTNGGERLPVLWTARCILTHPTSATVEKIPNSDIQLFLRESSMEPSIYRPATIGMTLRGHCTVRIREVLARSHGRIVVEGTLLTDENLLLAKNDLLGIRLNVATGVLALYGHLESGAKSTTNEFRFKTLSQKFTEEETDVLKSSLGISIPKTSFEVLPLLSTPYDLYSLGVLAVRIFLVDKKQALPIALDELLSFCHMIAADYVEAVELSKRVTSAFNNEKKWKKSLGPHHLLYDDDIICEKGFEAIPSTLWYDMLATMIRTFPGIGADSTCQDYSDAPIGAIHKVFEQLITDLDDLIRRSRSFILTDWHLNSEINSVIKKYLGK